MQAAEKKRPKEEREFINKHKPFAKLQTAEDFETMIDGFLCASLFTSSHPTRRSPQSFELQMR
jgi:hypothetical protein